MLVRLRTIVTYVLTSLYILIVGPIGLLIAVPFGWKALLYELGHAGVALALGPAGIRYRIVDRQHIPAGRAVVFCANHQSNVDPPVLFHALHRRLHILYKAGLRKIPGARPRVRSRRVRRRPSRQSRAGVCVDRGGRGVDPRAAIRS